MTSLQGDVQRQRDACERELAAKDREIEDAKQAAGLAELKKELQMRELMQEEILKAKEEAAREADERCKLALAKAEASCAARYAPVEDPCAWKAPCASPTCTRRPVQCAPACPPPTQIHVCPHQPPKKKKRNKYFPHQKIYIY